MTTKLTTVHAALVAKIESVLPGRLEYRLPNPYTLEANPDILLKSGYAIKMGPASNTERLMSCQASIKRSFGIVFTTIVEALKEDAETKGDIALSLLEDMMTFRLAIEKDAQLDQTAANTVYVSDTGIQESLFSEDSKHFYFVEATFDIEYLENYTNG